MMISGKWDVTAEVQNLASCIPQSWWPCYLLRLMDNGSATHTPVDSSNFCLEPAIVSPLGLEYRFLIQMFFLLCNWAMVGGIQWVGLCCIPALWPSTDDFPDSQFPYL